MIKIQKSAEPLILVNYKTQWTSDLNQRITEVGGYKSLSKADKKQYLYHYKHNDIHSALKNGEPVEKCIYCECYIDAGDPNVEHFHPKSIYTNETFEWDNLFSACVSCNRPKGNFDTVSEPFIHPVNDDPEEFLTYCMLRIEPRYKETTDPVSYRKGWNTINKCRLDRPELLPSMSDKLFEVTNKANELKDLLVNYNGYSQNACKEAVAREMVSKLNALRYLAKPTKEHAGYVRECLRQNRLVRDTLAIVNSHAAAIGLGAGYDWGWNFNLPREF